MKKIILFALMIAVICTAAFSQLAFSGYLNSGAGLGLNDADGSDPVFAVRANDAEQNGYRFRFNGQYQNEAKNAGARFRFQMQGGGLNPTISHAWGWVNFFDGKLQLNGGRIEESSWTTGDFWLASDSVSRFAGDGVLLKIMPVSGLALGAGAYVTGRDGANFSQTLEGTKFTGHLAYTMKDVFRVDISYRTDTWIDNPEYASDPTKPKKIAAHSGTSGDGPSMLFADIRLLMVKNLTAVIAAQINNLDNFSDIGLIAFSETFNYRINDQLNAGINAVQFVSNNDAHKDLGLWFNPWVSYAFGKVVPRLDAVYFMGGNSAYGGGNLNSAWYRHSFSPSYNSDDSNINIRPSVTINVDNRTKLEIGDSLYFDNKKAGNVITNVFYIDFIWNF